MLIIGFLASPAVGESKCIALAIQGRPKSTHRK
jgi:hypothetical protein